MPPHSLAFGDDDSMIVVAMLYESGNSRLGKDLDKAKALYRKVISTGHTPRAIKKAEERLQELE